MLYERWRSHSAGRFVVGHGAGDDGRHAMVSDNSF
jgi:hypothetical protein